MPSARPIALLTDFGAGDPYVAAMKGVILSRLSGARIVDVTHEIPRHDVRAAAYALWAVEGHFPRGTIFVCVVDPGVGTDRRILLLERGGRRILAPDNGLLDLVADGGKGERWHALRLLRAGAGASPTFHGRDVFAPAAARLAGGTSPVSISDPVPPRHPVPLFLEAPPKGGERIRGTVLHVDHFGNIITNIRLPARSTGGWAARISGRSVAGPYRTYDAAPPGRVFLLRGSTGLLEISLRRGDASKKLRVSPGNSFTFMIQ